MQFINNTKILAGRIPPKVFVEVEDYAKEGRRREDPLGDPAVTSLKEEYRCEIPPKFLAFLQETIHTFFDLHKDECGFYGITSDKIQLTDMWVNVMKKGDTHSPHIHGRSLYSFVLYINTTDNDAPFYYIEDGILNSLGIHSGSQSMIMIFPSTMIHGVYPKTSDPERISVSGNISIRFDT